MIRFDPETRTILETINVNASIVTSVVFGGENLDTLYVTTATYGLNSSILAKYPHSGFLFEKRNMPMRESRSTPYPQYFVKENGEIEW